MRYEIKLPPLNQYGANKIRCPGETEHLNRPPRGASRCEKPSPTDGNDSRFRIEARPDSGSQGFTETPLARSPLGACCSCTCMSRSAFIGLNWRSWL
jgi:hypothetical protein